MKPDEETSRRRDELLAHAYACGLDQTAANQWADAQLRRNPTPPRPTDEQLQLFHAAPSAMIGGR